MKLQVLNSQIDQSVQNDSIEDVNNICDAIDNIGLICDFNLVRYNPASSSQGLESNEKIIQRNIEMLSQRFKFHTKIQIIPRVGFDVKASCGMFV